MFAEVESGDETMRLLIDSGLTSGPLINNMDLLGVEPSSIDAIFLTHCHYDHTGGLGGLLKETRRGIPVIAHPSIFRKCYTKKIPLSELDIRVMSATDIQFPDSHFDFIFSRWTFQHIDDVATAVKEANRVLKKSGIAQFKIHLYPHIFQ